MNLRALGICVALTCGLTACGPANNQDNVARERERARESQTFLYADYKALEGHYASGDPADAPYSVDADIEIVQVSNAGALVPSSTLAGVFHVKAQNYSLDFSFSDGIYDSSLGIFSARVSGINTDGIIVSCAAVKSNDLVTLKCKWIPKASGADRFKFTLNLQPEANTPPEN